MVITSKISLQTEGNGATIDITSQIQKEISANNINIGTVTVFVSGSTAGLSTIEYTVIDALPPQRLPSTIVVCSPS